MKKMLFHYPGPFYERLDTGEKKRPFHMCAAFAELGYEVLKVVGVPAERKALFQRLAPAIGECEFVYSENSNLPLALTRKWRLPWPNSFDYQLFRWAQALGVPSGVFYRDIYWKFPLFRQRVGWLKYLASIHWYHQELKLYAQTGARVFVPSKEFAALTPHVPPERMHPLPPADEFRELPEIASKDDCHFVYVGSVAPPTYDIRPALAQFAQLTERPVKLTINTREAEWGEWAHLYELPANAAVCHYHSEALGELLKTADVALMYLGNDDYRKIAMPLKLFEAIGYGLPIVSYGDNAASRFIQENDIGWVVHDGQADFSLAQLIADHDQIGKKAANARELRQRHTWTARAREAARLLRGAVED